MMNATLQYGFGGPRVGSGRIHVNSDPPRDFDIHLGAHIFYDVGAVGDRGSPIQARHSVGFGFGKRDFFVELGFPIRSTHVQPIFMMGVRF